MDHKIHTAITSAYYEDDFLVINFKRWILPSMLDYAPYGCLHIGYASLFGGPFLVGAWYLYDIPQL